uniref:Uncharacterized protein n=1 Tax=Onchocerca volvulus TaxID=6282 RepID=A0A8R1XRB7_ONCVO
MFILFGRIGHFNLWYNLRRLSNNNNRRNCDHEIFFYSPHLNIVINNRNDDKMIKSLIPTEYSKQSSIIPNGIPDI